MSEERWGALPLGELHLEHQCAFCGARQEILKRAIIRSTLAWGYRCVDSVACIRRKAQR